MSIIAIKQIKCLGIWLHFVEKSVPQQEVNINLCTHKSILFFQRQFNQNYLFTLTRGCYYGYKWDIHFEPISEFYTNLPLHKMLYFSCPFIYEPIAICIWCSSITRYLKTIKKDRGSYLVIEIMCCWFSKMKEIPPMYALIGSLVIMTFYLYCKLFFFSFTLSKILYGVIYHISIDVYKPIWP